MNHLEKAVQDLQAQLAALNTRIVEIERDFKTVTDLKGIRGPVGPRGPAGPIDAAVHNATREAVRAAREAVVYPFEAKVEQLREEFRSLRRHIDESIENAVANTVVKILQEYGVLDEVMNPINKAHLNLHLRQLGLLN